MRMLGFAAGVRADICHKDRMPTRAVVLEYALDSTSDRYAPAGPAESLLSAACAGDICVTGTRGAKE